MSKIKFRFCRKNNISAVIDESSYKTDFVCLFKESTSTK